jgi:hypothetical protein
MSISRYRTILLVNFLLQRPYKKGGAKKVRDLSDVAATSFRLGDGIEAPMNRMSLKTESGGSVKLRYSICHHNQ